MSNNFQELVSQNKRIDLFAYSVSREMEKDIREILKLILEKQGYPELREVIYTCLKELVVNAVKANFKNIFFEDYKEIDKLSSLINYYTALQVFKLELSREEASYLGELAQRSNLKVEIHFETKGSDLCLTVINPVPMIKIEQENVMRKLNDARKCENIAEYFKVNEVDPHKEGAGLGLILVTLMLKSLGIPGENFTVKSYVDRTVAKLIIPLTDKTLGRFNFQE
ncbi:hypothetical protein ACFL20_01410 [Spirochaetota bacterium]